MLILIRLLLGRRWLMRKHIDVDENVTDGILYLYLNTLYAIFVRFSNV